MITGKKEPEGKITGSQGVKRSLRKEAEEQLTRTPKRSPGIEGQTPEQLIHELEVHQIELETQAEELRRAHIELENSRGKYLDLYDFAPVGYLTLSDKAVITEANLTGATLLGVDRGGLFNARFSKFVANNDSNEWHWFFTNVLNQEEKRTCTLTLKRGTGPMFPAQLEAILTTGSYGAKTVRIAFNDITDIREAERALRIKHEELLASYEQLAAAEEELKAQFDALKESERSIRLSEKRLIMAQEIGSTGSWMYNLGADKIWGSADGLHIFGFPRVAGDFPINDIEACITERERVHQALVDLVSIGKQYNLEYGIYPADGSAPKVIHSLARLEKDAEGNLIGVMGVIQDITDRKRAEQALRESEVRFRSLFKNMDSLFSLYEVVLDKKGTPCDYRFIEINPGYEKFIGMKSSELIGRTLLEVFPLTESYWMDKFKEVYNSGIPSRFENYSKELGTYIELSIYTPQKGQIALISSDITERKQAEEALRRSNARQRGMIANITDVIAIIDAQGIIRYKSENIENIFGWKPEELVGLSFRETAHPDDVNLVTKVFQKLIGEENASTTVEYRYKLKDGNFHAIHLTAKNLIHDPTINGVLVNYHDISERKLAEYTLQRVNKKLNVISALTRKDLNGQFFALNGYLELTKKQLTGQGSAREMLVRVEDTVRLINKTIEYSKDYQDMGSKPPAWQSVKTVMLLGLSHISIGTIQHIIETEDLEIFADPLLEKVCQRLFESSVIHGDHVTRIRIRCTVSPNEATIVFEDDGIGIPQEKKEQIFLRGEVTRASRGSLIFIREILDITGITICENGEPGKGARFEMVVPKGVWHIAGK